MVASKSWRVNDKKKSGWVASHDADRDPPNKCRISIAQGYDQVGYFDIHKVGSVVEVEFHLKPHKDESDAVWSKGVLAKQLRGIRLIGSAEDVPIILGEDLAKVLNRMGAPTEVIDYASAHMASMLMDSGEERDGAALFAVESQRNSRHGDTVKKGRSRGMSGRDVS